MEKTVEKKRRQRRESEIPEDQKRKWREGNLEEEEEGKSDKEEKGK